MCFLSVVKNVNDMAVLNEEIYEHDVKALHFFLKFVYSLHIVLPRRLVMAERCADRSGV